MTPEQIDCVHEVAHPVVWRNRVLFTLRRPDPGHDAYTSQVFAVPLAGGQPVRISHGYADTALTRRGEVFALLRAQRGGRPQLHIGEHPGATRRLTNLDLGVDAFALRPDGSAALVVARIPDEGRYGSDPEVTAEAEAPRRIRHAAYLHNGLGYFRDRPACVLEVPVPAAGTDLLGVEGASAFPEPTVLAALPGDATDPQYSPSGAVRSVVAPRADPIAVDLRSTIWVLAGPGGGDAAVALDLPGALSVRSHRWLDDARVVLIAAELEGGPTDSVARLGGLFVHDRETGATRRLTDAETVDLDPGILEIAGEDVLVGAITDGAVRLAAVPLAAAPPLGIGGLEFLTPADAVVGGVTRTSGGGLVFTGGSPESFGEVYAPHALTAFGGPDGSRIPLPLSAEGAGGDVHGWVALPAGHGPHPVVLNIHGGPFSQYTHALFDETQVLVSAGYAVVSCNPRGSNGRGRSWGLAVKGDMAEPAADDVLAFLDAALSAHPQLDGSRIGVQGGSYGGYLTAMLIGGEHGDRFTAGIVERGFLVPESFIGVSDIGGYFAHEYLGTDPARIAEQSPLRRAATTRIPTLVMHSEQDLRCPLEQGQQYFAALQRAGVDTEFLVFPGENHELSRSGRPKHRIQRFEAVLDWWSRHL